jgi:hypothetical protein
MHLQYILNNLTEDEKKTCRKILAQKPLSDNDRYVIKDLLRRGYLIGQDSEEEIRLFSNTFAKMFLEESSRKKGG